MNYNTTEVETTESPSEEKVHSSLVGYTADARFESETQNSKEKKYPPATFKQVEDALRHISADIDRDEWVKIGMAIKSEFGDEGIDLFNEWSAAGKSYKFDDLAATWDSINAEGGITIGFLFKQAKAGGWTFKQGSPADIRAAKANKNKATQAAQKAADKEAKYKEGASNAQAQWALSSACDAGRTDKNVTHPYLDKKQIKSHGAALSMRGSLLIPRYYQGELVSLQTIKALSDGSFQKRNMKGARAKGSYFVIGSPDGHSIPASDDQQIIICEGFATGCSLHEKSGKRVVVVFSCNNYETVAPYINEQYPDRKITIAADNDTENEKNPGLTKAKIVADLIGCDFIYPDFKTAGITGSDFNDFFTQGGTVENIKTVKPVVKTVYHGIPNGYDCTDDGVVSINDGDPKMITRSPIYVAAVSHNELEENYGLVLRWQTMKGTEVERVIPKAELLSTQSKIPSYLADLGVDIVDTRGLMTYLRAAKPTHYMKSADKTGWIDDAFVLPTQTIREPAGERILYSNGRLSKIAKSICSCGTIDEWKAGMKDASDMVIFGVCNSLSAPVRYKVGVESGGFHFHGQTSQGKTTLLQAIASVWGNGSDPQKAGGESIYLQKWNATPNSMEAKAEQFNDLPLVIDEIGESDPKSFGQGIYRLASGVGKTRADILGDLKDNKSWRTLVISAGEVAVAQYIEDSGETVKGGHQVRLTDIDITATGTLFEDGTKADAMKHLCANHYGLVGPAFLEAVPDLTKDWENIQHDIIGPADSAIAKRVRKRFALAAYTGWLAAEAGAGLLPWTTEQIIKAIKQVYAGWYATSNLISDDVRGIHNVRDYILRNESRFEKESNQGYAVSNRAGWNRDDHYNFTPAAFKEACKGADHVQVRKKLKEKGLLHVTGTGRNTAVIKCNEGNVRVVAVKKDILSLQ